MSVIDVIVGLYAPHVCLGCGAEGSLLCVSCQELLPSPAPCCYRCKRRSGGGRTCADCRPASPLLSVNTVTVYDGIAKDLIKSLKFGRALAAAHDIGACLIQAYGAAIAEDVLLVPVPTARRRVRGRGYDQSVVIARALSAGTAGSFSALLIRHGSQEQKGADRQQRRDQLQEAYTVRCPERVKGARILLIDDVLTTGSTLEAAATVLMAAGARSVGALVFARA